MAQVKSTHGTRSPQVKATHQGRHGPKVWKQHKVTDKDWAVTGEWVRVKSSNVAAIRYDRFRRQMWVRFKGGSTYTCPDFSMTMARSYFTATSMGKHHWYLRRRGYEFKRMS